jgi:hypothetical protein
MSQGEQAAGWFSTARIEEVVRFSTSCSIARAIIAAEIDADLPTAAFNLCDEMSCAPNRPRSSGQDVRLERRPKRRNQAPA